MGYRDYSTAKGHIVDATGHGDFTTISAALTAASSGQTIFIRPGTYTENPTLKAGVNLVSFEPALAYGIGTGASPSNVIINGECTFSSAGVVGLSGITLQTNSNFALAVTGSAASIVNLTNCFINCLNNTGIQLSSSSGSSGINLNNCAANIDTTGIALFSHSGAGVMWFEYTTCDNSGSSSTASTVSGTGTCHINFTEFNNPITLSSSSNLQGIYCKILPTGNQTALTTSGTATAQIIHGQIGQGSASAISVGAGTTVTLHYCFVSSSNTTTITGSGTLSYTNLICNSVASLGGSLTISNSTNNSFIAAAGTEATSGDVLTSNGNLAPPTWQAAAAGAMVLLQTQTASNVASIAFSSTFITATYNSYMVSFQNVVPASNGVTFEMQVSTNNGTSYLNTGYSASACINSSAGTTGNDQTTFVPLSSTTDVSNTATDGYSGNLYCFNMTNGTTPSFASACGYKRTGGGANATVQTAGTGPATTTVNNIKFFFSTGNISTGSFSLYGIKN